MEHEKKEDVKGYLKEHLPKKQERIITRPILGLMVLGVLIILFNQFQINSISGTITGAGTGFGSFSIAKSLFSGGDKSLKDINVDELKSTGHTLAAVFPVKDIKTSEDAMKMLLPTGTPAYGKELGVSFDDPVGSLTTLSNMYRGLKAEVQQKNPEAWQRFMTLASKPVGISCEYCCGLGAVGVDKNGNSACGCQHNPALLSIALYLTAYSDYSEGEILREVMRWKTLFFPKNMIELGMTVSGGDKSKLDNLPGMVGGC